MEKQIITLPHHSLRQRSERIGFVGDEVQQLIQEMEQATLAWEQSRQHELGVALAAVQINELKRVIIIRSNLEDKKDTNFTCYINPEIVKREGAIIEDYEGCLSVKDVYGLVPRYERIKMKALDRNGDPVRVTAEGFMARVLQHEIDHTNGMLYIDHIKDNPEAFFRLQDDGKLEQLDYNAVIAENDELWQT